jgi:hypothetical protein
VRRTASAAKGEEQLQSISGPLTSTAGQARREPSSLPSCTPPPPSWPAKEARRQPSPLLMTPRRLIEGRCRRQAPVQDPPWIWREVAGDGPPGVAPPHQDGKQPLPPPDQALADSFKPIPLATKAGQEREKRRRDELDGDDCGLITETSRGGGALSSDRRSGEEHHQPRPALDLAEKPGFSSKPNRQTAGNYS